MRILNFTDKDLRFFLRVFKALIVFNVRLNYD